MADSEVEDSVTKAIEACNTAQAMIDINAEHLDGLRTQCATSAELTQHEIRTLEVSFSCRSVSLYLFGYVKN